LLDLLHMNWLLLLQLSSRKLLILFLLYKRGHSMPRLSVYTSNKNVMKHVHLSGVTKTYKYCYKRW
jgi:hypothetical protein